MELLRVDTTLNRGKIAAGRGSVLVMGHGFVHQNSGKLVVVNAALISKTSFSDWREDGREGEMVLFWEGLCVLEEGKKFTISTDFGKELWLEG